MYTDHLTEDTLHFDQIFLDPNNPRFWTEKGTRQVPDSKIPDDQVQSRTGNKISDFGIRELRDSILRNGFLPLDRIVVRRLQGHKGQFVIVEGNRRFEALTVLRQEITDETIDEEGISSDYLDKLIEDTSKLQVLIYDGAGAHDISWLLQGIRHISGIRKWDPAQRGRLVAEQIENKDIGFKAAGQMFGLSAQAVGRLYRAYKALDQMCQDQEFSSLARNDYFTLFAEAIRIRNVKEWLGWENDVWSFLNRDNLERFYSWISEDERHDNKRRIHDPRHVKLLGDLIAGNHNKLMDEIDGHDITIEEAHRDIIGARAARDWKEKIEQATRLLADLPQRAMIEEPEAFLEALDKIEEEIRLRKAAIAGVRSSLA